MARVTAGMPDPDPRLREAVYGVAATYLEIDIAEVRGDARLYEAGLDVVELAEALEIGFDLELPDEALARVVTLDDLVRVVEAAPKRSGGGAWGFYERP